MKNNNDNSEGISFENKSVIFDSSDFKIMDTALNYNSELRLCAGVLKEVKKTKTKFPIETDKVLINLLPKSSMIVEGHYLNEKFIKRYLHHEFFPILNEDELIDVVYVALMTCKNDINWAAKAPSYARELLIEYSNLIKKNN